MKLDLKCGNRLYRGTVIKMTAVSDCAKFASGEVKMAQMPSYKVTLMDDCGVILKLPIPISNSDILQGVRYGE